MAVNEQDRYPSDIQLVLPKQKDMEVLGVLKPVYKTSTKDTAYQQAGEEHVNRINSQSKILERDRNSLALEMEELMQKREPVIYNGERVNKWFYSLNRSRQQESVELLEGFNKQGGNYYAFDIETFGDTSDNIRPYGVSEIAINEYDEDGKIVERTFNAVVKQDDKLNQSLSDRIQQLKTDKYVFNTMDDWEKRSIVDLMRYSSIEDGGSSFYYNAEEQEIKHNSIIKQVFDSTDSLDESKVVRYMDDYIKHMESGLQYMSGKLTPDGIDAPMKEKEAMQKVSELFHNNEKYFVSYNGNNFDIPQLQAVAKRNNIELSKDVKHLDLLNVIRTATYDSDDLKMLIDPDYVKKSNPYAKDKLAAYVHLLSEKSVREAGESTSTQSEAHNSQVDTDNTARVTSAARWHLQDIIDNADTEMKDGFGYRPTELTWDSEADLTHGQKLFANGGVMAFQEGDESFVMKLNEDGQWVPKTNEVNKSVITSKSFYQFAGIQEMSDDKLAFRFYNADTQEYSYIVRGGENAFNELKDFVQSRFYNWDNVPDNVQHDIIEAGVADRARRRYDKYFSMDGAGWGLSVEDGKVVERGTKGYSGLKRMVANAEKMKIYQDGKGLSYREKVAKFKSQGMTEAEAKHYANPIREHELLREMNFDSIPDFEKGGFKINESEKEQFFKMHNRLIDELPYLNQAIEIIDKEYDPLIEKAAQITNEKERAAALRDIGQKRDRAISQYQAALYQQVGRPERTDYLKSFESRILRYYDPEVEDYRSINFETVGQATNNINSYAKRGVEDGPKKAQHMKERMTVLVNNLFQQNKISKEQQSSYLNTIHDSPNSPYVIAQDIALDMTENNANKYERTRTVERIDQNKNIQQLSLESHEALVQRALLSSKNVGFEVDSTQPKGKQLVVNEGLDNLFSSLDQKRLNGLEANNRKAVEELVASIQQKSPFSHIAIVQEGSDLDGQLKVYVYDSKNSIAVQNQLNSKKVPTQAVQISMPLINQAGHHKVGNRTLNAHRYAVMDGSGKNLELISSSQHIARNYINNMDRILRQYREGNVDRANDIARRTLNDAVENMAGAQTNAKYVGENDTMKASFDQSDFDKQGSIKTKNAVIQDLFYGKGFNEVKLTEDDFYEPKSIYSDPHNKVLRSDLTLNDIKTEKQFAVLQVLPDWAQEKLGQFGVDIDMSSVKSTAAVDGVVNTVNKRKYVPYGTFYDYGRDNAVQFENAYKINAETEENLKNIPGVSRDTLLYTESQKAYDDEQVRLAKMRGQDMPYGNDNRINMKMAYMTNDQFHSAVESLFEDKSNLSMLSELKLLNPDGSLNYAKLPRVYEQQFILAEDVKNALAVDKEKRYSKGNQFILDPSINLGAKVQPGATLGTRINDNGVREEVRYEGVKPATVVDGYEPGRDLVLKWEEDIFKFGIDGEKATDTVVSRKFIKALVGGDEDIAGIYNPDVAKHGDYGMVMAGEARILSEGVRGPHINKADQKKIIDIIEAGNIGLKWDGASRSFIDESFDKDIKRTAFQDVFAKLKEAGFGHITNESSNGLRIGNHEVRVLNVSKNDKVVNADGYKVLGPNVTGKEDGVNWGHRELAVLDSYSRTEGIDLSKTKEYVLNQMYDQNANVFKEVDNLRSSLARMTQDHSSIDALTTSDFTKKELPIQDRSERAYRGTIFDQNNFSSHESLMNQFSNKAGAVNQNGFWLELPSVKGSDGKPKQITIDLDGDPQNRKAIDKMFIPFTALEGKDGELHLRELQKNISSIYRRAAEVESATSLDKARTAQVGLQKAVDSYYKQAFKELSSSEGMLYEKGFKTQMASSASGLFKLMDLKTSDKLREQWGGGEYTIISENTARELGMFDDLKALQEGASKKEVFIDAIRYPTFHDGAQQFTKVRMGDWVKDGEFHTTSFASFLQNADSDGDNDHIVYIKDQKIQDEWKNAHNKTRTKFAARYAEHEAKEKKVAPEVRLEDIGQEDGEEFIPKNTTTTKTDIAAKTGKLAIGPASNFNLDARAVANHFFSDLSDVVYQIQEAGRGIEQKPIDSKHGGSIQNAALKMVSALRDGNMDLALEIDTELFGSKFQDDFGLKNLTKHLSEALPYIEGGMRNQAFNFAHSTGVNENVGIQKFVSMMEGQVDILTPAHELELKRRGYNVDHIRNPQPETQPIPKMTNRSFTEVWDQQVRQRTDAGSNKLYGLMSSIKEASSSAVDSAKGGLSQTWDSIKGMSGKNKAITGGAIALGGIAGYNILNSEKPERHYIDEEEVQRTPRRGAPQPAMNIPSEEYSSQNNANITVRASGRGGDTQQMASGTQTAMHESGMNHGNSRVTVNHNDNTQQLNRVWYRDKVQENI